MPSLLIVSFSNISADSRVLRQISALSHDFTVHTVGYGPVPPGSTTHLQVPSSHSLLTKIVGLLLLLTRRFDLFFKRWFNNHLVNPFIVQLNPAVTILNDVTAWPIASTLTPGTSILDAHEYSLMELSDQLIWSLFLKPFKTWCASHASLAAYNFSVEQHLCTLWSQFSGRPFLLLPNSSSYAPPLVHSHSTSSNIRVLHHGVAHPSRRIEHMIEAIYLAGPTFQGTFLLNGSDRRYLQRLRQLSSSLSSKILPPIPQEDLISYGSSFDLAILSIYPSNLNYKYCLPNKLFQFIQSRLPIVCGPTPSISKLVQQYEIGVVAADFTPASLAKALKTVTPASLSTMRANLEIAAADLCWENDQVPLVNAARSITLLRP